MAITNYEIKEEDVKKAKTYVPLSEKVKFVNTAAERCIEGVTVRENGKEFLPMAKENTAIKSRYLIGAFMKFYFGKEFDPVEGDDYLLAQDDYDRFMRNHPFNALERMKSSEAYRNIIFDLISDYKDLEKRLNTEVYSLLQVMNDPVARAINALSTYANPTVMEDAKAELEKVRDELEAYKATKAKG